MRLQRLSPLALVAVLLLLQSCSKSESRDQPGSPLEQLARRFSIMVPSEQIRVPDFELENLQGRRVSLNDFRGKILLLTFSTTW